MSTLSASTGITADSAVRKLQELRAEAGFPEVKNPRAWSRDFLRDKDMQQRFGFEPQNEDDWPKNKPIYQAIERRHPGFSWKPGARRMPTGEGATREAKFVVLDGIPRIAGIHPTLADLLVIEPNKLWELADGGSRDVGEKRNVGGFENRVSHEVQTIPAAVVGCLSNALRLIARKTSSKIVRLDMAPMTRPAPIGRLPIYECEPSPGLSLALELNETVRQPLCSLFSHVVLPAAYPHWVEAYKIFGRLGIPVYNSWASLPDDRSGVYASCEPQDVDPGFDKDRLVTDPWARKDIDFPLSGGRYLHAKRRDTFEDLEEEFSAGFAIKPVNGWGASDVMVFDPQDRKHSHTRARIESFLEGLQSGGGYVVQPFYPPVRNELYGTLIWRVFAVRESPQHEFRLIGGVWNARTSRSLIVHGAKDAVFGPLMVA